jgi:hypothetical protein
MIFPKGTEGARKYLEFIINLSIALDAKIPEIKDSKYVAVQPEQKYSESGGK